MARFFSGSGEWLTATSTPITARPLTMACWFRLGDVTGAQVVFSIDDGNASGARARFIFYSNGTTFIAQQYNSGGNNASAPGTLSADTWYHGCAVFTDTDVVAYLDGSGSSPTTTTITPTGIDTIRVGTTSEGSGSTFPFHGDIAGASAWDVALSAGEITALAAGAHPYTIQPKSLQVYLPLNNAAEGVEVDRMAGLSFAETGTPDYSESFLTTLGGAWTTMLSAAPTWTPGAGAGPVGSGPVASAPVAASVYEPGVAGVRPQGPFRHPFFGAFGGPI